MPRTTKSGTTDKRHETSKSNANRARAKLLEYIQKGKNIEESDSEPEPEPVEPEPVEPEPEPVEPEPEPEPVVDESDSSSDSEEEIKPTKPPLTKGKKTGKTKKLMAEIDDLKNLVRGMKPIEKPSNKINFNYEIPSYKYEKKSSFENDRRSTLKNSFLSQFS